MWSRVITHTISVTTSEIFHIQSTNYWKIRQIGRFIKLFTSILAVKLYTMYAPVLTTFWKHLENCILILTMSNLRKARPKMFQPKLRIPKLDATSPYSNYLYYEHFKVI